MARRPGAAAARRARPVLAGLKRRLARQKRVRFAYAYGSFLRRRDARDIDVAVFLEGGGDPWGEVQDIAGELEKAVGYRYRLDVHSLNAAAPSFAFQVLSDGRLLCERERQQRLDWEAHTLSAYQDIRPMLDFHDRRFLSR